MVQIYGDNRNSRTIRYDPIRHGYEMSADGRQQDRC